MVKRNPKDKAQKDESSRDEDDTTPFANFQDLLDQVLSVPKEELDKRRAEYERKKKGKPLMPFPNIRSLTIEVCS